MLRSKRYDAIHALQITRRQEKQVHRTIDRERIPAALAQAAIEELQPQARPGPASVAAAQVLFMQNLAHGAEVMSALREACKVIEDSARDSFFRTGMTQVEFERAWRSEELQRWAQWTRLKTVAGLPHTQPELAGGD